ncbi:amidohydrolase family protein [Nitrosococcus wardiae]|uniref:Amidohydrolase n=1 Tax=Nitrosococcus wardiae TaxID=1814290 RepID=A0A4P7BVS8_9GAMM|nr:amidohydrolase family protein [Nitrosococcus wardiae]QBQ54148.1 amidohydrolase [Nitrosococcus wardiae]
MPMKENFDPEGLRLPIKLDSTSNGEFMPYPLGAPARAARELAHQRATLCSQKAGLSRRSFLKSLGGAAATLLAMNEAYAYFGKNGGWFEIPAEAIFEPGAAQASIGDNHEFIFDIQGHHVNPQGAWRRLTNRWTYILRFFPQSRCGDGAIECFSAEHFIREVFLDSDTDMAVLSAVPAAPEDNPLSTEEAAATRALVEAMEGNYRLLIHGLVHPNLPGAIEEMAQQKEKHQVAAWKTYTQWGPEGKGYWLDDEQYGIPFIERARELGVKLICVHKGIPLFNLPYAYSTCRDIGVVARHYPDVNFIVYHSGFEPRHTEGPYDPANVDGGVDTLIQSLQENDIPPNSNVYAELGTTWRMVMQDPNQAAHLLGKLFKYVGENNVLWGTDSIWYGSPQDQIQAFRAFQISPQFRDSYGYPEITPALRAKVFGLNAAKPYGLAPHEIKKRNTQDRVAQIKQDYLQNPEPSFLTNGPKTRREFLQFHRLSSS